MKIKMGSENEVTINIEFGENSYTQSFEAEFRNTIYQKNEKWKKLK